MNKKTKQFLATLMTGVLVVTSATTNLSAAVLREEPQPIGVNVALNKTVTVTEGAKEENAKNITDGNLERGWQPDADKSNPENDKLDSKFVMVDLEETYIIDKVKLYWETANGKVYDIYVSEDGEDWGTPVYEETTGEPGENVYTFEAVKAAYIKVELKERGTGYGYNLFELEAYTVGSSEPYIGDNLALNATATASVQDGANGPEKAIDGNEASFWQTPKEGTNEERADQWIVVTWNEAVTFNEIKAVWGGGYMKGYEYEVSDDGQEWTKVGEVTDGKGGESRTIVLDEVVTTKNLRLHGTVFGGWCYELKEVAVYDTTNIPANGINMNCDKYVLYPQQEDKKTVQLEAKPAPENASNVEIEWSSEDDTVATVDANGLVTGVAEGTTNIIAKIKGTEYQVSCEIVVKTSIEKAVVTATKVSKEKSVQITWDAVENAKNYDVYRVVGETEEKIAAEITETEYKDADLESGTYQYKVVANPDETKTSMFASTSDLTEEVLIPVFVSELTLEQTSATVKVGEYIELKATVSPDDATDATVEWSSSDDTVATVDEFGYVEALKEGTVTITATTVGTTLEEEKLTATCELTVEIVDAESITLDKTEDVVEKGDTVTLTATIAPENTTYKDIEWITSDEEVATVDEFGVVTAVGVGEATITATAKSGVTAEYKITVTISVAGVALNKDKAALYVGDTETLQATIEPEDAVDQTMTWESSDDTVATVDEKGKVVAVAPGTATITVTASGFKAECEVTVSEVPTESTTQAPDTQTSAQDQGTTQATGTNVTTPAGQNTTAVQNPTDTGAKVKKPGKVQLKVKKSAKKANLSWKKVKGAKGYQVSMKSGKGKFKVVKTITKAKTVKYTKTLKPGTYIFKVRAYAGTGKKKVFGKYSKAIKVVIS